MSRLLVNITVSKDDFDFLMTLRRSKLLSRVIAYALEKYDLWIKELTLHDVLMDVENHDFEKKKFKATVVWQDNLFPEATNFVKQIGRFNKALLIKALIRYIKNIPITEILTTEPRKQECKPIQKKTASQQFNNYQAPKIDKIEQDNQAFAIDIPAIDVSNIFEKK